MKSWPFRSVMLFLAVALAAMATPLRAQHPPPASLSSTPLAVTTDSSTGASTALGAQPGSAADALPAWPPSDEGFPGKFREDLSKPLSTKKKLTRAIKQAVFPGLLGTAFSAGIGMAADTRLDRDYGMGGRGFLRRWSSDFGDNAVGVFVGDFAAASAFHQDPRYHPENRRGFGRRLWHALAAVVVAQSDTGRTQFNTSHLTGILVGSGVSTAWHHSSDRSARLFGESLGYDLADSAGYNILAEFLFYRKHPRK